jgi:hypothetical protein
MMMNEQHGNYDNEPHIGTPEGLINIFHVGIIES